MVAEDRRTASRLFYQARQQGDSGGRLGACRLERVGLGASTGTGQK